MIKFNWKESMTINMGSSQHTLYKDMRYKVVQECILDVDENNKPYSIEVVYWIIEEEGTEFQTEEELRKEVEKRIKEGKLVMRVDHNMWGHLQIPDFDYYSTNRPEQFAAYMKWIEENMKDKEKFLKGINKEFALLIGE